MTTFTVLHGPSGGALAALCRDLGEGIDEALPEGVRMIHGPGCPVCVTPLEQVDKALAIAARPDVIFTSYGDMLRVPGSSTDLLALKARGADVKAAHEGPELEHRE
jgi:hydrogenase expression/formation protein HypD